MTASADNTSDHRWLMQYNIVNLVNQCRRLIRAEFDDSLSLTDPRLREKLANYAGRTRSQGLQRLYGEIRLALIQLEGEDTLVTPEAATPIRRYRGQPIDAGNQATQTDTGDKPHRGAKTLMYRGRAVAQR